MSTCAELDAPTGNRHADDEAALGSNVAEDQFWYSRRSAALFVLFLLALVQPFSLLTPPLQSPDEPEHLKRAYLLSKGEIFPRTVNGMTGGYIDTGLLQYMESFDELQFRYEQKVDRSILQADRRIGWAGTRDFRGFPNTAFYFPLPYLPQALAFSVGQGANLTVQQSYYLARLLSLLVTAALILAALMLYPMPLLVVATFLTPMTLFQLGSASLDAVTFGLSALAGALFMKGADEKYPFGSGMHLSLIVCVFLLASSRIALFPLTLLPLALYCLRKSRLYLLSAALLVCSSAAWIIYALETVKGVPARSLSTMQIITSYLANPGAFVRALVNTITSSDILDGYWRMFIGILGWADAPLGSDVYIGFGALFIALTVLSIAGRRIPAAARGGSLYLAGAAASSLLLLYFVFLVTYDPYPAQRIEGIQGRYFIPILILFAYSFFGRRSSTVTLRIAQGVLSTMILFAIAGTIPCLLYRYWMA